MRPPRLLEVNGEVSCLLLQADDLDRYIALEGPVCGEGFGDEPANPIVGCPSENRESTSRVQLRRRDGRLDQPTQGRLERFKVGMLDTHRAIQPSPVVRRPQLVIRDRRV
jgi:hypothetical protein